MPLWGSYRNELTTFENEGGSGDGAVVGDSGVISDDGSLKTKSNGEYVVACCLSALDSFYHVFHVLFLQLCAVVTWGLMRGRTAQGFYATIRWFAFRSLADNKHIKPFDGLRERYMSTFESHPEVQFDPVDRMYIRALLSFRERVMVEFTRLLPPRLIPPILRVRSANFFYRLRKTTEFFYSVVLSENFDQVVILSAGSDTTAYRWVEVRRRNGVAESIICPRRFCRSATQNEEGPVAAAPAVGGRSDIVKVFEVDSRDVLDWKTSNLRRKLGSLHFSGISAGVRYVKCESMSPDVLAKSLLNAGFESGVDTAVIMQGTLATLQKGALREIVEGMKRAMAGNGTNSPDLTTTASGRNLSASRSCQHESRMHYRPRLRMLFDFVDTRSREKLDLWGLWDASTPETPLCRPITTFLTSDLLDEIAVRLKGEVLQLHRSTQELKEMFARSRLGPSLLDAIRLTGCGQVITVLVCQWLC